MAVHFLNSRNIYHRDVKPNNCLLKTESNGVTYLHLSDFGVAKNTRPEYPRISTNKELLKGTVVYSPPEALNPLKDKKMDISKRDVWSIGVIAY